MLVSLACLGGITITIPTTQTVDSTTTVISFSRAGNLILVRARVDSIDGNFILDTGAPNLVLNITWFREYPSTLVAGMEQASMTATSAPLYRTNIDSLSIGNLRYTRLKPDLVNLAHLENSKGVQIMGLLGMDLFRDCELMIDYENNQIYLHRINQLESSGYRHAMLVDTAAYHTIPIELIDNRIIAKTVLAGKKLNLLIDCAAESNVLDSRLPNKVFENVTITRKVKLVGANQAKVDALFGTMKNMKIGKLDFEDMQVLITNLEKTCFSDLSCVDGILGYDFLSQQKIGFNFVKRQMYIWK